MQIKEIIDALKAVAPERWQEGFDNTGLQVGDAEAECSGAMLCVDATPEIVAEAVERGCNLIITHHPLIFRPLKSITGHGRVAATIVAAIRAGVAIYSCHTSIDNAPAVGVSWEMGKMLGLSDIEPLERKGPEETGCGIIGTLPRPMTPVELVETVKQTFGTPTARCSSLRAAAATISRIGLCGGAGSFLIDEAVERGAQAFITSDCKHNHFIDFLGSIFLVDIGHYESEECTKRIFYHIIKEKFANFAVYYSQLDKNPINYL